MLLRPLEYVRGVIKLWLQAIAGPVLALIGIGLSVSVLFVSDAPTAAKWGALITGGVALLMIFPAQYKLWSKEKDQREAEQAKNQRPELKGEAFGFEVYGNQGHGHEQGDWSAHAEFCFRLDLCNHRNVTTNITAIKLDGSSLQPAVKFDACEILRGNFHGAPPDRQLEPGIGKPFRVKSDATVDGLRLSEVTEIDLERLKIYVVDGFGGSHVIQPRSGEKLAFSRT